jgi:hypothetical protein
VTEVQWMRDVSGRANMTKGETFVKLSKQMPYI